MLTEIQLRNFRCFDDHTVPLRERTVVVGKNNAGKSTVVEALRLVSLVANRYGNLAVQRVPPWLEIAKIHRGVAPALSGYELNSETLFHRYGDPPARITARFGSGDRIEIYVGEDTRLHAVVFDADDTFVTGRGAAERGRFSRISILPQVGPLQQSERLLDPIYVKGSMDSPLSTLHFRNQIFRHPEYVDEFQRISAETWSGLRVDGLVMDNGIVREPLQLMIRDGDFVAEVARMGHGLQMWLQTMWFLARARNSPTVILDEPDVYMHADLQRRLIRFLKTRHHQTVIATHSVEIMAEVEPDEVLVINKSRRRSQFANSLPAVQSVIDRIGGVHNMQLAKLWTSRRCLLIEGDDVAYLRMFHSAIFPNAVEPLDAMPRVPLGGWSGFPYAIGSRMLLKNAGGEAIIPYCILDSDFHTDAEIEERYDSANANGVELHVWRRKEIENYLLCPTAIHRVMVDRVGRAKAPDVARLTKRIDKIAESLRAETTDKIASELYVVDRAGGIERANVRARQRVAIAWDTEEGRWGIVSGKAVLSALANWTQATVGKAATANAIARVLRAEELPAEVRGVLRAIEMAEPFPPRRPQAEKRSPALGTAQPSTRQDSWSEVPRVVER